MNPLETVTPPDNWEHALTQLRDLMDERDRRYEQRFEAQQQAIRDAMAAQEKAVAAALQAADRAVQKAESASERRFESVNEFRATLSDQAAHLMPRQESVALHTATREKVEALTARIERSEGKSTGLNAGWGYLVGAIGLLGGILAIASRFL